MGEATIIAGAWLAERERWILWLPVALAAGIGAYFALPDEPARWVGPVGVLVAALVGIVLRGHATGWAAAVAMGTAALGFTLAVERSASVAAPVLDSPTGIVEVEGRIVDIEPLEHGIHRFILDRLVLPPLDGPTPTRIRVRMTADELHPGQRIALRAALLPPPSPAAPGAYDFSRQAWFLGIGGVGYAIGQPRLVDAAEDDGSVERLRLRLANLRHALSLRITAAIESGGLDAGVGAVAAALITAERGPVSPDVLQAYRDAGLAHILVIAGMHMSMVAGLVFVALRGGLAAIPAIALRYPIKKWTAAGALLVTFGYLVISGGPIPTQRAFMMNAIMLLAVLIDREAISLRSITWAALVILALRPESLVGASFQMSFAAVYGLIAGYEVLGPRLARWRQTRHGRWAVPVFYVLGILLTTQIAGTATAFYTIFHFNRYAIYSLLGNFLAVPIVGFWVMPSALLAFCLMPFGLDGWGWQAMGWGIVGVSRIAGWVSTLPGATLDLPSIPVSALVLFTVGGLWLCLWKTRWRLWGLAGMAAALLIYGLHRPPDLLVDPTGQLVAGRAADGSLTVSQLRAAKAVREAWTKQAGQGAEALLWGDAADDRLRCDGLGCVYRTDRHMVSIARHPQALEDDCRIADVVFVAVPVAHSPCPSARLFIDGRALAHQGTYALWLDGTQVRLQTVSAWQGRRPWNHLAAADDEEDRLIWDDSATQE